MDIMDPMGDGIVWESAMEHEKCISLKFILHHTSSDSNLAALVATSLRIILDQHI